MVVVDLQNCSCFQSDIDYFNFPQMVSNLTIYELPLPKPMLDSVKFCLKTELLSEVLEEIRNFPYPHDNKLLKTNRMGKQNYEIFKLGIKAFEYQISRYSVEKFHSFEDQKMELFYRDYLQILSYLEQLSRYSFLFSTPKWKPYNLIDKINNHKALIPIEQRIIYILTHYITLEEMQLEDYSAYQRLVYFKK